MFDPFLGKLPQLFDVGEIIGVLEIEEQAFLRIFRIRFEGCVEELEFLEVCQDDEGNLLRVSRVVLSLEDMVHIVERHGGCLGFDEKLGVAIYAETVVRPEVGGDAFFMGGKYLNDDIALIRRFMGLVLDVPSEGFEEGVEEIDSDLGFGVALLEVVVFVLFELFDQRLKVSFEGLEIGLNNPRDFVITYRGLE